MNTAFGSFWMMCDIFLQVKGVEFDYLKTVHLFSSTVFISSLFR